MNEFKELRVEIDGHVAVVTLDSPPVNALTRELNEEMLVAFDRLAETDEVRAIVLTGAGKCFCAGADLKGRAKYIKGPGDILAHSRRTRECFHAIRECAKPVVAAVNGVAAGAGANFALGCDRVVAARSASFIQAFSKIGLVPDCGGTWLLPRLVGRARALGLALTGDKLSAEEAQRIGLIWQCVDDAALMDSAQALAAKLAALPSRALVDTRRALDAAAQLDYAQALALEARMQRELGRAHDFAEGVAAFRDKRAARFTDR